MIKPEVYRPLWNYYQQQFQYYLIFYLKIMES